MEGPFPPFVEVSTNVSFELSTNVPFELSTNVPFELSTNVLLLSSLSEISTCIVGFLIVTVFDFSFVSDLLLELESSIINGFFVFKFCLSFLIKSLCNSSVSSSESFFSTADSIADLFIFNNSSVSSSES